jgi:hypothetical protein
MQIFEITQRQPVNEIDWGATKQNVKAAVSPALARGAAVGGGFAGALGNAITNAPLKALGARTGADLAPDPDAVGLFGKSRAAISDRMAKAVQAAMPAITQQAAQQQRMWSASVADLLKKSGAQNMSQINPAQLKNVLMTQVKTISNSYNISNYKSLPREVNPEELGGQARQQAMTTVRNIDAALAAIMDPEQQSGSKAQENWLALTKELYAAGVQRKFRERDYYSGSSQSLSEPSALSRMLASNPQALSQIQRNAQQAGVTPEQLQALGITPQATVTSTSTCSSHC